MTGIDPLTKKLANCSMKPPEPSVRAGDNDPGQDPEVLVVQGDHRSRGAEGRGADQTVQVSDALAESEATVPAVGELRLSLVDPDDGIETKFPFQNCKLAAIAATFDQLGNRHSGDEALFERNPAQERSCLARSAQEVDQNGRVDDHGTARGRARRCMTRRRSSSTKATGS